jgi:hypothetical protein
MLADTPIPDDELLAQLPLFLDGPTLARVLFMNELYQLILPVHGSIMEFGVRWGRDLALWTQLRGIYEPFNWNRHIVGFDTWGGYPPDSVSSQDGGHAEEGDWTVTAGYQERLDSILTLHEELNPVSHLRKFSLVHGDASKTLPLYLEDHAHTVIALAYFDMDIYQPTKDCLEAILPRLTRGSVLGFDELNCREDPGETLAVMEVLGLGSLAFQHSHFSRGNSYAIVI